MEQDSGSYRNILIRIDGAVKTFEVAHESVTCLEVLKLALDVVGRLSEIDRYGLFCPPTEQFVTGHWLDETTLLADHGVGRSVMSCKERYRLLYLSIPGESKLRSIIIDDTDPVEKYISRIVDIVGFDRAIHPKSAIDNPDRFVLLDSLQESLRDEGYIGKIVVGLAVAELSEAEKFAGVEIDGFWCNLYVKATNREGSVQKRRPHGMRTWQKRWLTIGEGRFQYFAGKGGRPCGQLMFRSIVDSALVEPAGKLFTVSTSSRVYEFQAENNAQAKKWVDSFKKTIEIFNEYPAIWNYREEESFEFKIPDLDDMDSATLCRNPPMLPSIPVAKAAVPEEEAAVVKTDEETEVVAVPGTDVVETKPEGKASVGEKTEDADGVKEDSVLEVAAEPAKAEDASVNVIPGAEAGSVVEAKDSDKGKESVTAPEESTQPTSTAKNGTETKRSSVSSTTSVEQSGAAASSSPEGTSPPIPVPGPAVSTEPETTRSAPSVSSAAVDALSLRATSVEDDGPIRSSTTTATTPTAKEVEATVEATEKPRPEQVPLPLPQSLSVAPVRRGSIAMRPSGLAKTQLAAALHFYATFDTRKVVWPPRCSWFPFLVRMRCWNPEYQKGSRLVSSFSVPACLTRGQLLEFLAIEWAMPALNERRTLTFLPSLQSFKKGGVFGSCMGSKESLGDFFGIGQVPDWFVTRQDGSLFLAEAGSGDADAGLEVRIDVTEPMKAFLPSLVEKSGAASMDTEGDEFSSHVLDPSKTLAEQGYCGSPIIRLAIFPPGTVFRAPYSTKLATMVGQDAVFACARLDEMWGSFRFELEEVSAADRKSRVLTTEVADAFLLKSKEVATDLELARVEEVLKDVYMPTKKSGTAFFRVIRIPSRVTTTEVENREMSVADGKSRKNSRLLVPVLCMFDRVESADAFEAHLAAVERKREKDLKHGRASRSASVADLPGEFHPLLEVPVASILEVDLSLENDRSIVSVLWPTHRLRLLPLHDSDDEAESLEETEFHLCLFHTRIEKCWKGMIHKLSSRLEQLVVSAFHLRGVLFLMSAYGRRLVDMPMTLCVSVGSARTTQWVSVLGSADGARAQASIMSSLGVALGDGSEFGLFVMRPDAQAGGDCTGLNGTEEKGGDFTQGISELVDPGETLVSQGVGTYSKVRLRSLMRTITLRSVRKEHKEVIRDTQPLDRVLRELQEKYGDTCVQHLDTVTGMDLVVLDVTKTLWEQGLCGDVHLMLAKHHNRNPPSLQPKHRLRSGSEFSSEYSAFDQSFYFVLARMPAIEGSLLRADRRVKDVAGSASRRGVGGRTGSHSSHDSSHLSLSLDRTEEEEEEEERGVQDGEEELVWSQCYGYLQRNLFYVFASRKGARAMCAKLESLGRSSSFSMGGVSVGQSEVDRLKRRHTAVSVTESKGKDLITCIPVLNIKSMTFCDVPEEGETGKGVRFNFLVELFPNEDCMCGRRCNEIPAAPETQYMFSANSKEEREAWVRVINEARKVFSVDWESIQEEEESLWDKGNVNSPEFRKQKEKEIEVTKRKLKSSSRSVPDCPVTVGESAFLVTPSRLVGIEDDAESLDYPVNCFFVPLAANGTRSQVSREELFMFSHRTMVRVAVSCVADYMGVSDPEHYGFFQLPHVDDPAGCWLDQTVTLSSVGPERGMDVELVSRLCAVDLDWEIDGHEHRIVLDCALTVEHIIQSVVDSVGPQACVEMDSLSDLCKEGWVFLDPSRTPHDQGVEGSPRITIFRSGVSDDVEAENVIVVSALKHYQFALGIRTPSREGKVALRRAQTLSRTDKSDLADEDGEPLWVSLKGETFTLARSSARDEVVMTLACQFISKVTVVADHDDQMIVSTPLCQFQFAAENSQDCLEWVDALSTASSCYASGRSLWMKKRQELAFDASMFEFGAANPFENAFGRLSGSFSDASSDPLRRFSFSSEPPASPQSARGGRRGTASSVAEAALGPKKKAEEKRPRPNTTVVLRVFDPQAKKTKLVRARWTLTCADALELAKERFSVEDDQHSLFLPANAERPTGTWMRLDDCLEAYNLVDGEDVHFRLKMRLVRVQLSETDPQEEMRFILDDSRVVGTLLPVILTRIGEEAVFSYSDVGSAMFLDPDMTICDQGYVGDCLFGVCFASGAELQEDVPRRFGLTLTINGVAGVCLLFVDSNANQGWLHKRRPHGLKTWQRRWFVLRNDLLSYYLSPDEKTAAGEISVPSMRSVQLSARDAKKDSPGCAFQIDSRKRTFHLSSQKVEETEQWMAVLRASVLCFSPETALWGEDAQKYVQDEGERGFSTRYVPTSRKHEFEDEGEKGDDEREEEEEADKEKEKEGASVDTTPGAKVVVEGEIRTSPSSVGPVLAAAAVGVGAGVGVGVTGRRSTDGEEDGAAADVASTGPVGLPPSVGTPLGLGLAPDDADVVKRPGILDLVYVERKMTKRLPVDLSWRGDVALGKCLPHFLPASSVKDAVVGMGLFVPASQLHRRGKWMSPSASLSELGIHSGDRIELRKKMRGIHLAVPAVGAGDAAAPPVQDQVKPDEVRMKEAAISIDDTALAKDVASSIISQFGVEAAFDPNTIASDSVQLLEPVESLRLQGFYGDVTVGLMWDEVLNEEALVVGGKSFSLFVLTPQMSGKLQKKHSQLLVWGEERYLEIASNALLAFDSERKNPVDFILLSRIKQVRMADKLAGVGKNDMKTIFMVTLVSGETICFRSTSVRESEQWAHLLEKARKMFVSSVDAHEQPVFVSMPMGQGAEDLAPPVEDESDEFETDDEDEGEPSDDDAGAEEERFRQRLRREADRVKERAEREARKPRQRRPDVSYWQQRLQLQHGWDPMTVRGIEDMCMKTFDRLFDSSYLSSFLSSEAERNAKRARENPVEKEPEKVVSPKRMGVEFDFEDPLAMEEAVSEEEKEAVAAKEKQREEDRQKEGQLQAKALNRARQLREQELREVRMSKRLSMMQVNALHAALDQSVPTEEGLEDMADGLVVLEDPDAEPEVVEEPEAEKPPVAAEKTPEEIKEMERKKKEEREEAELKEMLERKEEEKRIAKKAFREKVEALKETLRPSFEAEEMQRCRATVALEGKELVPFFSIPVTADDVFDERIDDVLSDSPFLSDIWIWEDMTTE